MDKWPPPDSSGWRQIGDPTERLSVALRALYAFYRVAGRGLIVIMRDAPLLRPELRPKPSRADLLRAMTAVLLQGWGARGRRRVVLEAVIAHATSVDTWHSLIEQQGLSDNEAIDVLTAIVVEVAGRPRPGRIREHPAPHN